MGLRTRHSVVLGCLIASVYAPAGFAQTAAAPKAAPTASMIIKGATPSATLVAAGAHTHHFPSEGGAGGTGDSNAAPALLDLGSHTFPVTTRNKLAQRYVNQGMNLSYGFNHAEA